MSEGKREVGLLENTQVSRSGGALSLANLDQVAGFAKVMAAASIAIPKHLRDRPGDCAAITMQALHWEMDPYQVANKSYSVNDRLAYESQLIYAVIQARAPVKGRIRQELIGEGPDLQCRVWAHVDEDQRGDDDDGLVEYTSPKLKDIGTKNSPLWKADPGTQITYYSNRAFARLHFAGVLMGVYTVDEIRDAPPMDEAPRDITPEQPKGGMDRVEALRAKKERPTPKPADEVEDVDINEDAPADQEPEPAETQDAAEPEADEAPQDQEPVKDEVEEAEVIPDDTPSRALLAGRTAYEALGATALSPYEPDGPEDADFKRGMAEAEAEENDNE